MALGSYKLIGTLSRALIARRNGNSNPNGRVSKLDAHDDSSSAHPYIQSRMAKMDGKLDHIKGTTDQVLGRLDAMGNRPCQVGSKQDGN